MLNGGACHQNADTKSNQHPRGNQANRGHSAVQEHAEETCGDRSPDGPVRYKDRRLAGELFEQDLSCWLARRANKHQDQDNERLDHKRDQSRREAQLSSGFGHTRAEVTIGHPRNVFAADELAVFPQGPTNIVGHGAVEERKACLWPHFFGDDFARARGDSVLAFAETFGSKCKQRGCTRQQGNACDQPVRRPPQDCCTDADDKEREGWEQVEHAQQILARHGNDQERGEDRDCDQYGRIGEIQKVTHDWPS